MKRNTEDPDWHDEIESWPEAWQQWGWLAGGSMILFGAADDAIAPALAEVRTSVEASGESPEALYGDAVAYGRTLGTSLRPAGEILEPSAVINTLPGLAKLLAVAFGGMLVVLGIWIGIERGWRESSFDGPVALVFPMVTALMGLGVWGWTQRTRGRLRAAWAAWIGTVAGFAGGIWLVSGLPDDVIAAPANWIVAVLGGVLMLIGLLPPWPKPRGLVDDTGWDDERWFGHAENLLRGRYLLSKAQAVAALREARAHREFSGSDEPAEAEFGNVEVFTAYQAAANAPAIRRVVRLRHAGWLAVLLGYGSLILAPKIVEDGLTWQTGILSAILVWLLFGAVTNLRPAKLDAAIAEKTRGRNADALALDTHQPRD